jgi:uncharacterized protein (TIGR02391 family)
VVATALLSDAVLQRLCDVLGDTALGLTGSQIGRLLDRAHIRDEEPMLTKRHRLFAALAGQQRRDGNANRVLACLQFAMDPVLYTADGAAFEGRRAELNEILAFSGMELGEDGKLRSVVTARTLSEAKSRADRLRRTMIDRSFHPEVLKYCRPELVERNYFHAVFEATKGLAERIRLMTGLQGDGAALLDGAFAGTATQPPLIAFNTLRTETEGSEQRGLATIAKGVFAAFRNVTAHAPKKVWPMSEEDALDVIGVVSLLHRRLDSAAVTRSVATQTS